MNINFVIVIIFLVFSFWLLYVTMQKISEVIEKQNKNDDDDQNIIKTKPIEALHCLESFNYSEHNLNVLAECIKTLDDSELTELSGYSLQYTKNKETNKIEFKKV